MTIAYRIDPRRDGKPAPANPTEFVVVKITEEDIATFPNKVVAEIEAVRIADAAGARVRDV